MKPRFADVALAIPSQGPFQYSIPDDLADRIELGKRVYVPVKTRRMLGYVVGFSDLEAVKDAKTVEAVIDEVPVLDPPLLELTRWMSEYYVCSWGQAIEAALPAPFKRGKLFMKSRPGKNASKPQVVDPDDLPLTRAQQKAYDNILLKIRSGQPHTVLLHGVTGSGKTEVYMHLIRELIRESRSSIVLVPEISLTPQTVDRFFSRFGA